MSVVTRRIAAVVLVASASLCAPLAHAITFDIGDISGTLNTTITAGAGMRMKDRNVNLIGKADNNPSLCGGIEQSCQGVFKDQTHPARTLARGTGTASINTDDGDLNYNKGDLTQAVLKATQDLKLTWGEYGFFAKWLYFYDFVNNNFTEFHPNMITADNRFNVGCTGAASGPQSCTNNDAQFSSISYGPGTVVRRKRTDGETLRQIGTDFQLFDYYVFGSFKMPFVDNKDVSFKVGSQNINWGESTVFVLNSINQVNPLNANNFTRVGFDLSELFTPTGMVFLSTEIYEGITTEAYYGYNWKPVEIPAPGSFFSFADLGTNNAFRYASISFGGPADDPDVCGSGAPGSQAYNPQSGCGAPTNNPLAGLTNTSLTIRRQPDHDARSQGQFGIAFKYFADWLNNGTQLSFYFENYHSKLPYISFYSSDAGCAKNATSSATLLSMCGDNGVPGTGLPIFTGAANTTNGAGARSATHNAVPIDTVKYFVEYPEDIHLFGMSFNTTVGDISLQGEVSYRPNLPVQIQLQDLTFLALQPMLTNCQDASAGCVNSSGAPGSGISGADGVQYGSSNFQPYPGITAYTDTFNLAVGAADGSARSFPSFIGQYRGIPAGHEAPNTYIKGYERFGVWQTDLGATYIQGATDNVIGADQVIWLAEWGVQYVPNLPKPNVLQIQTPGANYHASAGADGTMTGNMQQDCASTIDCNYNGYNPATGQFFNNPGDTHPCTAAQLAPGASASTQQGCGDGLRFNPHQEPAKNFANYHNYSTGIAMVNLTRYESVFPGVSFAPITIFQWGVYGTSVDVANQFIQNKKQIIFLWETRYKESLSWYVGHVWITGGGQQNQLSDRNQLLTYVKYLF